MATARDGCCVPTEPLGRIVREFVDDWNRQRPQTGNRFAGAGFARCELSPVEPLAWLAGESGVSKNTLEKLSRATPETIKEGRRAALTELAIADRIVTALGRPETLHDGTLPVVSNRHATTVARGQIEGPVWSDDGGAWRHYDRGDGGWEEVPVVVAPASLTGGLVSGCPPPAPGLTGGLAQ